MEPGTVVCPRCSGEIRDDGVCSSCRGSFPVAVALEVWDGDASATYRAAKALSSLALPGLTFARAKEALSRGAGSTLAARIDRDAALRICEIMSSQGGIAAVRESPPVRPRRRLTWVSGGVGAVAALLGVAVILRSTVARPPDGSSAAFERVAVRFTGGALLVKDVTDEIRRIHPQMRFDTPGWKTEVARAVTTRRLMLMEAETKGLPSPSGSPEDRERALMKQLVGEPKEGWAPSEARSHRKAFDDLVKDLWARADASIDSEAIVRLPVATSARRVEANPPPSTTRELLLALGGSPVDTVCTLFLTAGVRTYGANCGLDVFSEAVGPMDLLYLDLLQTDPGELFAYRFDFAQLQPRTVLLSHGSSYTAAASMAADPPNPAPRPVDSPPPTQAGCALELTPPCAIGRSGAHFEADGRNPINVRSDGFTTGNWGADLVRYRENITPGQRAYTVVELRWTSLDGDRSHGSQYNWTFGALTPLEPITYDSAGAPGQGSERPWLGISKDAAVSLRETTGRFRIIAMELARESDRVAPGRQVKRFAAAFEAHLDGSAGTVCGCVTYSAP
jgi:hypothetical protein